MADGGITPTPWERHSVKSRNQARRVIYPPGVFGYFLYGDKACDVLVGVETIVGSSVRWLTF